MFFHEYSHKNKRVRISLLLLIILGTAHFTHIVSYQLVSIITSLYNADEFIKEFLKDITRQTIFDQCELIIINANSPGNEENIIKKYMQQYPNIIYKRINHDPGIYAVWNIGILMAHGKFITNANVDDRLAPNCYEMHSKALQEHPEIDLVYSDCYITYYPNETFEHNQAHSQTNWSKFSTELLLRCNPPHCNPMWRRCMHQKYGFFDESFKHAGDWEMWIRASQSRSLFMKVHGIYVLYYKNPKGLSTDQHLMPSIYQEHRIIKEKYFHRN